MYYSETKEGGINMEVRRQPLGIELVRRGVITQLDIEKAIEYQKP